MHIVGTVCGVCCPCLMGYSAHVLWNIHPIFLWDILSVLKDKLPMFYGIYCPCFMWHVAHVYGIYCPCFMWHVAHVYGIYCPYFYGIYCPCLWDILPMFYGVYSLQNKCRTADADRKNLGFLALASFRSYSEDWVYCPCFMGYIVHVLWDILSIFYGIYCS